MKSKILALSKNEDFKSGSAACVIPTNLPLRSKTGAPTSPGPKAKLDLSILVGNNLFPKEYSLLCSSPKVGPISNSRAHVIPIRKEPISKSLGESLIRTYDKSLGASKSLRSDKLHIES